MSIANDYTEGYDHGYEKGLEKVFKDYTPAQLAFVETFSDELTMVAYDRYGVRK